MDEGFERLLQASHFQSQALLVEMARNQAVGVLGHMTDMSLSGTERAASHVRRAVSALEKAHASLLAAELSALENS